MHQRRLILMHAFGLAFCSNDGTADAGGEKGKRRQKRAVKLREMGAFSRGLCQLIPNAAKQPTTTTAKRTSP